MDITVTVDLPPEIEQRLEAARRDLAGVAREAVAVDLFRRGILSHFKLAQMLGLDRFEVDALLKRHGVAEQSLTHDEVDADRRSIDELIGSGGA
jgi:predicted HTH domain antitoxin